MGEAGTARHRVTPRESRSLVVSVGERRQRCLRFLDPGPVQTPPAPRDREGIQMSLCVGLPHQHQRGVGVQCGADTTRFASDPQAQGSIPRDALTSAATAVRRDGGEVRGAREPLLGPHACQIGSQNCGRSLRGCSRDRRRERRTGTCLREGGRGFEPLPAPGPAPQPGSPSPSVRGAAVSSGGLG